MDFKVCCKASVYEYLQKTLQIKDWRQFESIGVSWVVWTYVQRPVWSEREVRLCKRAENEPEMRSMWSPDKYSVAGVCVCVCLCRLTLDGGRPGAVVENSQLSKHLPGPHVAQHLPLLRHDHLAVWKSRTKHTSGQKAPQQPLSNCTLVLFVIVVSFPLPGDKPNTSWGWWNEADDGVSEGPCFILERTRALFDSLDWKNKKYDYFPPSGFFPRPSCLCAGFVTCRRLKSLLKAWNCLTPRPWAWGGPWLNQYTAASWSYGHMNSWTTCVFQYWKPILGALCVQ